MNFNDAQLLCELHMEAHGLLKKGWSFKWMDRAKRKFGECDFIDRTIALSLHLTAVNEEKEVELVILHEVAHALVGVRRDPHDRVWQSVCLSIGGDGKTCYTTNDDSVKPVALHNFKYLLTCPNCGKQRGADRAIRKIRACGVCCDKFNGGKFDARFQLRITQQR